MYSTISQRNCNGKNIKFLKRGHDEIRGYDEVMLYDGQSFYVHGPGGHPFGPGERGQVGPQLCGQRASAAGAGQSGIQPGGPGPAPGGGGQKDPAGGSGPAGGGGRASPVSPPGADAPLLSGHPGGGGGEPPPGPAGGERRTSAVGSVGGDGQRGLSGAGQLRRGYPRPIPPGDGGFRRRGDRPKIPPPGAGDPPGG